MNNISLIGTELAKGICEYFGVDFPYPNDNLYRVRRTWNDPSSQIGAFLILNNAKRLVDNNPGYYVYNDVPKIV